MIYIAYTCCTVCVICCKIALGPLLPLDARHRRPGDARLAPSRALHDLHIRGGRGMENTRARGRARGWHLARACATSAIQPALLRPDGGDGKAYRQRCRPESLAQPARRTHGLLSDRRIE